MNIAAVVTSLPLDFETAVGEIARLGFSHIDVVGQLERPATHLEALAATGLLVSCAAVGRNLPVQMVPDAVDIADRQRALSRMQDQVADAARLGATHCYLIPGMDGSRAGLARLADTCAELATFARSRMMQLCIEHFPGRALPTVQATLKWLEREQLDDMRLLLDVGHCLISDEDPAQSAVRARRWLGYVHFDDNDSVEDLHWPLLTGRLTADMVDALMAVLRPGEFHGGLALELNPRNPDPIKALGDGKTIIERALGVGATGGS
jgi:sugar phosphate isomerase/epimerase